MRVGITGHQRLTPKVTEFVQGQIGEFLSRQQEIIGISSLAAGADQIFARIVLMLGGQLEVVIPSERYETSLSSEDRREFKRLLRRAQSTVRLPYAEPSEEAFMAAGRVVSGEDLITELLSPKAP